MEFKLRHFSSQNFLAKWRTGHKGRPDQDMDPIYRHLCLIGMYYVGRLESSACQGAFHLAELTKTCNRFQKLFQWNKPNSLGPHIQRPNGHSRSTVNPFYYHFTQIKEA